MKGNNFNQDKTWKSSISRIFLGLKSIPYKFMLILILLSLWLGEWYPISNFPMYSAFGNSDYFIYISDGSDRPIPLEQEFGLRTAFLKKVYKSRHQKLSGQINPQEYIDRGLTKKFENFLITNNIEVNQKAVNRIIQELSEEIYRREIEAKAGKQVLQYVINERNSNTKNFTDYKEVKLWYVLLTLDNQKIIREPQLLAELKIS